VPVEESRDDAAGDQQPDLTLLVAQQPVQRLGGATGEDRARRRRGGRIELERASRQ
jgi:hypothetical protein